MSLLAASRYHLEITCTVASLLQWLAIQATAVLLLPTQQLIKRHVLVKAHVSVLWHALSPNAAVCAVSCLLACAIRLLPLHCYL